jgi:hypothetical protein
MTAVRDLAPDRALTAAAYCFLRSKLPAGGTDEQRRQVFCARGPRAALRSEQAVYSNHQFRRIDGQWQELADAS